MRLNPCHATDFRPATLQHVSYVSNIALKRQLVSNKCTQNSSKFLPNPWSSLIPKWFPDGFLYIPWSWYRGALGAPLITAKSTTDPSLRHRSAPSTQVQRLRGSLGLRLDPGEVTGSASTKKGKKKKTWPDWSCFKCLILCWCLPFQGRFVELLAVKPSSTQTSQNCPESRVVWFDPHNPHLLMPRPTAQAETLPIAQWSERHRVISLNMIPLRSGVHLRLKSVKPQSRTKQFQLMLILKEESCPKSLATPWSSVQSQFCRPFFFCLDHWESHILLW